MYHISHTLALIHSPNISFSCISTQYEIVSCPFQMPSDTSTPTGATPRDAAEATVPTTGDTASIVEVLDGNKPDVENSPEPDVENSPEPDVENSPDDDSNPETTGGESSDSSSSSAKSKSASSSTESDDGDKPTGVPKSKPAPKGARASKEVPKGTPSNGTRNRIPRFPSGNPIQNNNVLLAAFQAPAASGGQREAPAASGGQLGQPRGQQRGKPFSVLTKELPNGVNITFPATAFALSAKYPIPAHADKQR